MKNTEKLINDNLRDFSYKLSDKEIIEIRKKIEKSEIEIEKRKNINQKDLENSIDI